jgi:redox-sensitive bicupin YhaK (pirin superfamily)
MHGLQLWVALPLEHEEDDPSFQHVDAASIPELERPGARLRVVAGEAYGARSPARVLSPLFYVEARLEAGAALALPDEHASRAVYVVEGTIACEATVHPPGGMIVFHPQRPAAVTALEPARLMLLGGAPLEGERHISWNFVSSRPERIERAKQDWREGRFPRVPGDETEFIPLPEGR